MRKVLPFVVAALVLACLAGAILQLDRGLEALFALDSTRISRSVIALIAIGLLAMALIQAARSLFPMRGWFHEQKVKLWAGGDVSLLHQRLGIEKSYTAFYDLPIQNICGQIGAVAEAVLVECTSRIIYGTDWMQMVAFLRRLAGPASQTDLDALEQNGLPPDEELSMRRARLGSHIQRNIDNLQITTGTSWRRRLRILAFGLSFLLSASLLLSQGPGWQVFSLFGASAIAGLIAGYLASVFRDIVAVVEGLRRP